MRTIGLPNGRAVTLGTYVASWRTLKGLQPDALIRGWDHFPERADRILRRLHEGMHDRINRHIPGYGKGRKWDSDWQREVIQTAYQINRRVRVYSIHRDLRRRLAHRLASRED